MFCRSVVAAVLLAALPCAQGRVNLVTLPGRDTVQLTIYNSVDLTMVKETRHLTFRKGINKLEFSWANTLIDPTSVEFRPLTHADQIEVVDIRFPPRVTNLLEWHIQSEYAGEADVEIRYFTSGIRWAADYVAEAAKNEKTMGLSGYVRVFNNSGEDYENAEVRLVVGVIHLVEEIAQLAQAGRPSNGEENMGGRNAPEETKKLRGRMEKVAMAAYDEIAAAPAQIVKEGVSEYFLYTVEGRDTIPSGWSKRLPSFHASDVPLVSYYKYEEEQWAHNVMRFYRFKNDKAGYLGEEPLPDGNVKAFRTVTDDGLYSFVGSTSVKYIPVDEQVDLNLGYDPDVTVKPTLMSWEKTDIRFGDAGNVAGWATKETWSIELQNSKDIDIVVDIRRNCSGDWAIDSANTYEKVDANKVKFVVPLKPREQQKITYTLTTQYGINVRR